MKESLERIKAWAKQHPYLAGVILLGVLFLAYLAIKRGGGGGGFSSGPIEPAPEPGGKSADLSGLGSGGDTGTSAGGFSPVETVPAYAGNGSGNGDGSYPGGLEVFAPRIPEPVYSGSSAPGNGSIFNGNSLQSPQLSMLITNPAGDPVKSFHPATTSKAREAALARVTQTARTPEAAKITDPKKASALNAPGEQKGKQKNADMTPAQKVGKGRYFTGYWQGVYYIAGYPRTVSAVGTIGTNTGGNKPTQLGGGKRTGK